ncbi:MAG: hypothetical protein HYV75_09905 [Opitutae bacterium]|nr:hypothetical protein [Opitutae bacterium]
MIAILLTGGRLAAQTGRAGVDYDTFRVAGLTCMIGNNLPTDGHAAGYNGIFWMTGADEKESVYAPASGGLNLEHYFDARSFKGNPPVLFEPRYAPMKFRRLDATTAELTQAATPLYGVESRTVFALKEPHYIDIDYTATPAHGGFAGGFLGVFWASYINAPLDKSMYFLRPDKNPGERLWTQFATQVHGRDSAVLPAGDESNFALGDDPKSLFRHLSPLRYAEPFFYGRFRDMVLIYVFKPNPYLRFAHSPTGGARTARGDDTNPAWDFHLVMPEAEALKGCRLSMRIIYKRWAGRDDVLREVHQWLEAGR